MNSEHFDNVFVLLGTQGDETIMGILVDKQVFWRIKFLKRSS